MIALFILQVAQPTEIDQCYSVLLVGGIILILALIKWFAHEVGKGPNRGDIRDFQVPQPMPRKGDRK